MKKASDCIFIGGVHGVGKSSLCAAFSVKTKVAHYVASDLIKSLRNEDANLHKEVNNLTQNQDALLTAISLMINEPQYLLDGHFVVCVAGKGLSPVPTEIFRAIQPLGIIIVTGNALHASDRIKSRDCKDIPPVLLEQMQIAEIAHGNHVAKELDIPLHILDDPSEVQFHNTVLSFFRL